MSRARLSLVVFALASAFWGCVVIPYHPEAQTRRESAPVAEPERLGLSVGPRHFLEKLARGVLHENKRLQQVDGQTFLDTASPERNLTLARLLEPEARDRLAPLEVDYAVLFGQPTRKELEKWGGVIPGLGAVKEKDFSSYWAAVVDVRQMKLLEQLTSEATGTSMGAQVWYGLYVVSMTEGSARNNVVHQVAATLASAKPTGPARVAFLAVEPIASVEEVAEQAREAERTRELLTPPWSLERLPPFEEAPPPPPGEGLVYLYGPAGGTHGWDILMGAGEAQPRLTTLWSGGYFAFHAPAGELRLSVPSPRAGHEAQSITLNVEPGRTHYVEATSALWRPGLRIVDAERGAREVHKYKRVPTARESDLELLRRAELGDFVSQTWMAGLYARGSSYAEGEPWPRDDAEAYKWLSIAATNEVMGKFWTKPRDDQAAKMDPAQVTEGERRARAWLESKGKHSP
jgi:hypothetical protein